jgi:hypothetical protein
LRRRNWFKVDPDAGMAVRVAVPTHHTVQVTFSWCMHRGRGWL